MSASAASLAELNVSLLDRTLAHIQAAPQLWDPTVQHCGPCSDFLCRALLLNDPQVFSTSIWCGDITEPVRELVYVRGRFRTIHDAAALVLGLDQYQTSWLAWPGMTLERLVQIVEDIKASAK